MCILLESEGTMCDSENGFVSNGAGSLLLVFDCSLRLDSGHSVREATIITFQIGDFYSLSDLKELAPSFGLKLNYVTSRCGKKNHVIVLFNTGRILRNLRRGSQLVLNTIIVGLFVLDGLII